MSATIEIGTKPRTRKASTAKKPATGIPRRKSVKAKPVDVPSEVLVEIASQHRMLRTIVPPPLMMFTRGDYDRERMRQPGIGTDQFFLPRIMPEEPAVVIDTTAARIDPSPIVIELEQGGTTVFDEDGLLDPKIFALEVSLDLLEEKIMSAERDCPLQLAYEGIDARRKAEDDKFDIDFVMTDEMLAKALHPAVFSSGAVATSAIGSVDTLVKARKNAIDRARSVLADLFAQTHSASLGIGYSLEEKLVADARLIDEDHPAIAARIRLASRNLAAAAPLHREFHEDAQAGAGPSLDYVPTQSDRFAPPFHDRNRRQLVG